MSATIRYFRFQHKPLLVPGQVPTIPSVVDENQPGWIPETDIYIGEIAVNIVDKRAWIRTQTSIDEIQFIGGGVTTQEFPFTNQSQVICTHNLGRRVQVCVWDSLGNLIFGVVSSTLNQTTVDFSQALSGVVTIL